MDDTADGSAGSGLMHHISGSPNGRWLSLAISQLTLPGTHGVMPARSRRRGKREPPACGSTSLKLARCFRPGIPAMWGDGPGGEADSRFGISKGARRRADPHLVAKTPRWRSCLPPTCRRDPRELAWLFWSNAWPRPTSHVGTWPLFVSRPGLRPVWPFCNHQGMAIRLLADPGSATASFSSARPASRRPCPTTCKTKLDQHPWTHRAGGGKHQNCPARQGCTTNIAVIDARRGSPPSFNWIRRRPTAID